MYDKYKYIICAIYVYYIILKFRHTCRGRAVHGSDARLRQQRQLPEAVQSCFEVVSSVNFIYLLKIEMDVVLYIVAATILLVLIVFAVKVRGRTEEGE